MQQSDVMSHTADCSASLYTEILQSRVLLACLLQVQRVRMSDVRSLSGSAAAIERLQVGCLADCWVREGARQGLGGILQLAS